MIRRPRAGAIFWRSGYSVTRAYWKIPGEQRRGTGFGEAGFRRSRTSLASHSYQPLSAIHAFSAVNFPNAVPSSASPKALPAEDGPPWGESVSAFPGADRSPHGLRYDGRAPADAERWRSRNAHAFRYASEAASAKPAAGAVRQTPARGQLLTVRFSLLATHSSLLAPSAVRHCHAAAVTPGATGPSS